MKKLIEKYCFIYHSQDYRTQAAIDTIVFVGGLLFFCLFALIGFLILTI